MEILTNPQGSDAWLLDRIAPFTASEAPMMMGCHPQITRNQFLAEKVTGVVGEIGYFLQKIFDQGHKSEEMARPHIEKIIKDDLYPIVGIEEIDGITLMASFDGMDLMESIDFEHKQYNAELFQQIKNGCLPDYIQWQVEQQLLVSDAEKAIVVCSDGTPENMAYLWYYPNEENRKKLIDGWKQFKKDMKDFELKPVKKDVEVEQIETLPALYIDINGGVNDTNMPALQNRVKEFINSINKDLLSDEDFANAENQVKFCKKAEDQFKSAKQQALSKTADIEKLFNICDENIDLLRSTRLSLDKLIKTQKQAVKQAYFLKTQGDYKRYIEKMNGFLGGLFIKELFDFRVSGKNKRTQSSFQSALDDDLARAKIEIDNQYDSTKLNLDFFDKCERWKFLFPDINQLAIKSNNEFNLLIESRINKHKKDIEEKEKAAKQARVKREAKIKEDAEREARLKIEREEQARKHAEQLEEKRIENARRAKEKAEIKKKERAEASANRPVNDEPEKEIIELTPENITHETPVIEEKTEETIAIIDIVLTKIGSLHCFFVNALKNEMLSNEEKQHINFLMGISEDYKIDNGEYK
jgi:predicted phage-related endonuclease